MSINGTRETCYLYRFIAGSVEHLFTNLPTTVTVDDEPYTGAWQVTHTAPTYSGRAEDAEVDITLHEDSPLTDLFINGPPAYQVKVRIFECDLINFTVTPYYRGWVVRAPFKLIGSVVGLHCKSAWHYFERQSLTDSLGILSRYSIYDPRSGVDWSALGADVTVDALNDARDVLTVSGVTELDDYFRGGFIVAPDNDKRGILKHVTESGLKKLYLTAAFPQFTLGVGFTATVYPGDDLAYSTWANKFAALTNNGEAFGGWPYTPNVDPAVKGVI
jgi:hypothetical protein